MTTPIASMSVISELAALTTTQSLGVIGAFAAQDSGFVADQREADPTVRRLPDRYTTVDQIRQAAGPARQPSLWMKNHETGLGMPTLLAIPPATAAALAVAVSASPNLTLGYWGGFAAAAITAGGVAATTLHLGREDLSVSLKRFFFGPIVASTAMATALMPLLMPAADEFAKSDLWWGTAGIVAGAILLARNARGFVGEFFGDRHQARLKRGLESLESCLQDRETLIHYFQTHPDALQRFARWLPQHLSKLEETCNRRKGGLSADLGRLDARQEQVREMQHITPQERADALAEIAVARDFINQVLPALDSDREAIDHIRAQFREISFRLTRWDTARSERETLANIRREAATITGKAGEAAEDAVRVHQELKEIVDEIFTLLQEIIMPDVDAELARTLADPASAARLRERLLALQRKGTEKEAALLAGSEG